MKGCKKILIAVDGSKGVLKNGLAVARDEKCWVTVVKVVLPNDGGLNLTGIKNIGDVLTSGSDHDEREIREIAEAERALVKTRIEEGEADEKIVEVAEDEQCDLIIMGAGRKNWLRRLFRKNGLEKVINQAPCPVLVVAA